MRTPLARIAFVALSAGLATGCMFTVKHEIPPDAYFGRPPRSEDARERTFAEKGMKNWALAGLVPYSGWSSQNLLARVDGPGAHVEDLAIETTFGTVDTIVWVVPGFLYGYYVWAPRTVKVSGRRVEDAH